MGERKDLYRETTKNFTTEEDSCEPKLPDLPERHANKPEKEEAIKNSYSSS